MFVCSDANPVFDQSLQECERQQKRFRLQEMLTDHLVHRPGPLDLLSANILKVNVNEEGISDNYPSFGKV